MILPNVWGQGAIFAYSGLDGEQNFTDNYPASLLGDALGVRFYLNKPRELRFELDGVKSITHDLVASDIIKSRPSLTRTGENSFDFCLMWNDACSLVGYTTPHASPVVYGGRSEYLADGTLLNSDKQSYTALCTKSYGDKIYFSLGISSESIDAALSHARRALTCDVDALERNKFDFFDHLPLPKKISENEERTLAKCFSVMKSQVMSPDGSIKSRWTTPDRIPHKKIWIWDSVFHSFGNIHISHDLAFDSIRAVLDGQKEDGFVPIDFDPFTNELTFTQPPLLAWGLKVLFEKTKNTQYVDELFFKLEKYLEWDLKNRDSNKNFLLEWARNDNPLSYSDESGMDNCSRFDGAAMIECVDFSAFLANEARSMAYLAKEIGKPERSKYWHEVYERIKSAVNRELYNPKDGLYYDREIESGKLRDIKSVTCFIPLLAGIPSKEQAERLAMYLDDPKTFGTRVLIPTIGLDDPTFGTDMWRGPVWVNTSYMIAQGFREYGLLDAALKIERSVIDCVTKWYLQDGVLYEYFDANGEIAPSKNDRKGKNIQPYDPKIKIACIRDYGWSATLYAAMLLNGK